MKKFLFIAIIGIIVTSCATTYVAYSETIVSTKDKDIIYIKNTNIGNYIYKCWKNDTLNKSNNIVILMDTVEFNRLYEESYKPRRNNPKR